MAPVIVEEVFGAPLAVGRLTVCAAPEWVIGTPAFSGPAQLS
jgi:hypothetical protein